MSNHIIRNGVLMGLVMTAISIVFYYVNKNLLINIPLMACIGLAVPIYFMWKGAKDTRDEQEGLASFGEMFRTTFFIFIIGSFVSNLGDFALRKLEPSILEMEADAAIEVATNTIDFIAGFTGASEEQLAEMHKEMEGQNEATREQILNMGIGSVILNWLTDMILGVIASLIMGGVMKVN